MDSAKIIDSGVVAAILPLTPNLLARLRFRADDADDALRAAAEVATDPVQRRRLGDLIERVRATGPDPQAPSPFGADDVASPWGDGVLPMLAFLATVEDSVRWRAQRGVDREAALDAMADLGQQVWVHRRVHGSFGLHDQDWLWRNWAGGLLWLGRLQVDVEPMPLPGHRTRPDELALFLHIPDDGPLLPVDVDASLRRIAEVAPRAFPEAARPDLYCLSWLLDPRLADRLAPTSRIAAFARRFVDLRPAFPGDRDAIYFTFRREPPVDLGSLPRRSGLQRAVVDHLASGGHFRLHLGRIGETP